MVSVPSQPAERNSSASIVNVGGWLVKGSNSSGTVSTRAIINPGTILKPHCHYLLTNSNPVGGPYSGSVPGDQTYGVGITDDGGLALTMPDGTIVDQVGMSGGSVFKEGSTLTPLSGDSNRSYERRPGGASGSGQDTDNNQSDFRLISPSDPQSAGSTCLGGGGSSNPSGTGAATPSTVNAGATTLLTVNVSPGSNPTSTGITVTGNLIATGGSAAQAIFDDGTGANAIKDSDAALALFKKYKVAMVFVSHSHMYASYNQDGIEMRLTGGLGAPLVKGLAEADGGFHHFLLVDVPLGIKSRRAAREVAEILHASRNKGSRPTRTFKQNVTAVTDFLRSGDLCCLS